MAYGYKYVMAYVDNAGFEYRVVILEEDYTGLSTRIGGYAVLGRDEASPAWQAIRPGTLTIYIDADVNYTFDDLFSETERQFKVEAYRNGDVWFIGWLSPEGLYQDWVNSAWQITVKATDGLAMLKNLSYVQTDGSPWVGDDTLKNILRKCLDRTGIELDVAIPLQGFSFSDFDLKWVIDEGQGFYGEYFGAATNQARFVSDDGKTITSCYDVMNTILSVANCHIFQEDGRWWIQRNLMWAAGLWDNQASWFQIWPYDGSAAYDQANPVNLTIGSQQFGFYPHWAGENQRIETRPSIGAARINFKYGKPLNLLDNPTFINNGTSATGWTILPGGEPGNHITFPTTSSVRLEAYTTLQNTQFLKAVGTASVDEGDVLEINAITRVTGTISSMGLQLMIKLTGSVDEYWLQGTVYDTPGINWSTFADRTIRFSKPQFEADRVETLTCPPVPEAGTIELWIMEPSVSVIFDPGAGGPNVYWLDIFDLQVGIIDDEAAEGEQHTVERIARPSSFIMENETVMISDAAPTGLEYEGTLIDGNGDPISTGWESNLNASNRALLRTTLEDRMMVFGKPSRVFMGSVMGYVPYRSRVFIDGLPGVYVVTQYSCNSIENLTEVTLYQVHADSSNYSDMQWERIIDYGNVVEPTIKG